MLVAENIRKRFGRNLVLRSVSFSLHPGELVILRGDNGSGKSTLLSCLASVLRPDEGVVKIFGSSKFHAEQLRLMGYASQWPMLYAELTVRENLEMFGVAYGLVDVKGRVCEVLEEFSLGEFKDTRVRYCSQGVMQRVSLAKSILHHPKLLLLDEPFSHLDRSSSDRLEAFIREQVSANVGVLLSSHHERFQNGEKFVRTVELSNGVLQKYSEEVCMQGRTL